MLDEAAHGTASAVLSLAAIVRMIGHVSIRRILCYHGSDDLSGMYLARESIVAPDHEHCRTYNPRWPYISTVTSQILS